MAVSQIVDTDALYPCGIGASVHFVMKVAFRDFKQPVIFADSVELFHIVLHFFTEELRHFDRPVTFRRFRVSDDVPATDTLIGFADRDRLPVKIEIRRGQRQQFTLPDAAPIQHFKGIERNRLVHHFFGEFLVFLLRPEKHFSCLGLSHIADLGGGIVFQPVEFHGVIENCTELIVQSFEIYRRICLAALIPTFDHLILPSDNVFGLDRVHFPLGEVGKQFGADDMLLGVPSVLFQPVLHIGCVGVDKALKGHIQIGFHFVELFPLPSKSFSFGWKASLRRLVDFALPIREAIVDLPSVVFGIFINGHFYLSF